MQPYRNALITTLAIIMLAALGFWFVHSRPASAPAISDNASTTVATSSAGTASVTTSGGSATVSLVGETLAPPSLKGVIVISADLPPDAKQIIQKDLETIIAALQKDPTRVDLWLQLGVDRKIAGDYAGAIQAWNYVAAAAPASMSYVAYGDLGDLYMNFQKDYPKAEYNYKKAIAINPNVIEYYRDLFTLYRSMYKVGTGADAAILDQGLKANPNNPDLLELKSELSAQ